MDNAQEPSEAARQLARARWGSTVVVRAAETVIERQAELPPEVRAELRAAVGAQETETT
jgi:hypothetical protein